MKLVAAVLLTCVVSYPVTVAMSTANEWVKVHTENVGDIVATYFVAANAISPEDERGNRMVASKSSYNVPLFFPAVGKDVSAVYSINRINCNKGTAKIVADTGTNASGEVVYANQVARTHKEVVPSPESGLGHIVSAICASSNLTTV